MIDSSLSSWIFDTKRSVELSSDTYNGLFIHCTYNLWGDHPWLGGTIYGAIDSPGGPSMAAIVSPGGLPVATKFAVDGPAGPILGGPSVA